MIQVVRFKAEHLSQLMEQEATQYLRAYLTPAHIAALEQSPHSMTGLADGRVVICGGVVEYWPNRGEAWAIIDQNCKEHFTAIHNAVKRFFEVCPLRRIEAAVDIGFEAGHRWMRLLGFELEAPVLRAYRPEGGDCSLYARVKHG